MAKAPARTNKVDHSLIDSVLAQIDKDFGEGSWRRGDAYPDIERYSLRTPSLDAITDGGIPKNRWTRIWGPKSTGKSMLTWLAVKSAIEEGDVVAFHDIEDDFDPRMVKALGIDPSKLILFETKIIEEVCANLRKSLKAINLHILDSCSNAISLKHANADDGTYLRGDKADAWKMGLQKVAEYMNDDNTIIYVDQARVSQVTGGLYVPGGKFMEHQSSLTLRLTQTDKLYYAADGYLSTADPTTTTFSGQKEENGYQVLVNVEKSRVCPPSRKALLWLDLGRILQGQPFDIAFEYQQAMLWLGMATKNGTWFEVPNYGKAQGQSQLRQLIRGNKPLQEEVEQRLYEAFASIPEEPLEEAA
jgi:recombination protein RecA